MNVLWSYVALVVGIAIIGSIWSIIGGRGERKTVVRLTSAFVIWGVVCYTFQLLSGISV